MPWPRYLLERHLAHILEEVGSASGAGLGRRVEDKIPTEGTAVPPYKKKKI